MSKDKDKETRSRVKKSETLEVRIPYETKQAFLKACREETCGWVFYDGSRNRSSSWCSMQVCGGRAKASSYRRRQAARRSAQ